MDATLLRMTSTNDSVSVRLFPLCDRDGLLLAALASSCEESPATRADATLFSWMLGLEAGVDAVGAARAVLAVASLQRDPPPSDYRRALVDGLERFVADSGRVASLSYVATSPAGASRTRRRWRDRADEGSSSGAGRSTAGQDAERGGTRRGDHVETTGGGTDGKRKTRL